MAIRGIESFTDPFLSARSTERRGREKSAAGGQLQPDPTPIRPLFPQVPPTTGARVAEAKLEAIDLEVRAHEAAHLAAAGTAAGGGATFDYVIGPNGERYAVGGSVRVMAQPVYGDPEATIRKAEAIIRAAYAVSLPSSADLRIAAEAYQMEMDAKRELAEKGEVAAEGWVA